MKPKKEFSWWGWDITWVEIITNEEDYLELLLLGNVYSKKNSKRAFRWIVLPSVNFVEWHKRCSEELSHHDIKLQYHEDEPFKIEMNFIARNKVKGDIDNSCTSILDLLTDAWIIPDDNKFVVSNLSINCIGYVKNLPLTQVKIYPDWNIKWNDSTDNKDKSREELIKLAEFYFH